MVACDLMYTFIMPVEGIVEQDSDARQVCDALPAVPHHGEGGIVFVKLFCEDAPSSGRTD